MARASPLVPAGRIGWIAYTREVLVAANTNSGFKDHRYKMKQPTPFYQFWWEYFCDWYRRFKKLDQTGVYAYVVTKSVAATASH